MVVQPLSAFLEPPDDSPTAAIATAPIAANAIRTTSAMRMASLTCGSLSRTFLSLQLRPQQIPAFATALREGAGGRGAEGFTLDAGEAVERKREPE